MSAPPTILALLLAAVAALTLFGKARAGTLAARSCGVYLEKESAGARTYAGVKPALRTYRAAAAFAFIAVLIVAFQELILALIITDKSVPFLKKALLVGAFLGVGASAGVAAFDLHSDRLQNRHVAAAVPAVAVALIGFFNSDHFDGISSLFKPSNIIDAAKDAAWVALRIAPAFVALFILVTLEQRTRLLALDRYEVRMAACKESAVKQEAQLKDLIAQAAAPVELDPKDKEAPMTPKDVDLTKYQNIHLCEHLPHMHGREPVAVEDMAALRAHSDEVVVAMGANAFGATAALLIVGAWIAAAAAASAAAVAKAA